MEECAKMHDVECDIIISVASIEECGFMVECDEYQMEQPKEETYCSLGLFFTIVR